MAATHENFHISQKAVIYDPAAGKFLLMKYSDEPETGKDEAWSFVGGRMEEGENTLDALNREIREEIGDIDYEIIQTIDTHASGNTFRVGYLVFYKGGEIVLSEEHETFSWLSEEEIEKEALFHPAVRQFIDSALTAIRSQEYLNDLKRLQADFENYKKRQAANQKELGGYLIEKLVLDIIPVLDNFRSATQHVPEEQKESPWVVGIRYIEKQLETVLTDNGMQTIEAKEGEEFDPKIHEAVSSEGNGENGSQKHLIAKVLQKGYKFGEKVIRPARVIVT